MARQTHLDPPLYAQFPIIPATSFPVQVRGSWVAFSEYETLSQRMMDLFWDLYLHNTDLRKDPLACYNDILCSPSTGHGSFRGLPKAIVLTATSDVLRDEGVAYG